MGMFNSILADVRCPSRHEVARNAEIQIKWQVREARSLNVYHVGDVLERIEAEYDNTWIQTDYVCPVCSVNTTGKIGATYVKTRDQRRHPVFVRIEQGRIRDVLAEDEFGKLGVADFVRDL